MEGYVFYSSLSLIAMGGLALGLSVLFRLKFHSLNSLPRNLSASVFSRTFVVFDPYPQQTKVIHHLLLALPFVAFFVTLGLTLALWRMLASGLILSILAIIISLNLIVVEEAPEVYMNSNTFIKAVQNSANFAYGDLKALQILEKLTPKLSNYYLGLAIFLIASSIVLPRIFTAGPWLFGWLVDLIARSGGSNEIAVAPIVIILPALSISILQLLASKVKNKIFRYEKSK